MTLRLRWDRFGGRRITEWWKGAAGGQLERVQYELMRNIDLGVFCASNQLSPDTGPIRPPQTKPACVPLGEIFDAVKADRPENPTDFRRDAEKNYRGLGVGSHCMPREHGNGPGKLDCCRARKRCEPGEFSPGII